MKLVKVLKVVLCAAAVASLLCSCAGLINMAGDIYRNVTGAGTYHDIDRTGSWGQISGQIARPQNWRQIVKDSPFQLGDEYISYTYGKGEEEFNQYAFEYGTYPCIDGSTVCVSMAAEFAWQHLGLSDGDVQNFCWFSTTHYAYRNLITKEQQSRASIITGDKYYELISSVDIILATEPSDEELKMARDNGVELYMEPICWDAFVFITHKDNPVDSLTIDQIRDIYSGKITNWKAVGGKNEKITAYQREENSGSQTAMENLVMKGEAMIDPITVRVMTGMGGLIDAVAEYKNDSSSIGYTYKYYIDNLYKNENIKTIKIEGIAPSNENIRDRSYPFSTNYYGVIRAEDRYETGGKFLDWIVSDEGQACVAQAGYIAMR